MKTEKQQQTEKVRQAKDLLSSQERGPDVELNDNNNNDLSILAPIQNLKDSTG